DRWAALRPGLERIHDGVRRAWKRALQDPTVENLHTWRKRAKDLRYIVELLEPAWPEVIQSLGREIESLEKALGEDHDLAMLPAHVTGDSLRPSEADRELVTALVDVRRRDLQAQARTTADRLCRERPRAFADRLGIYWKAWRREAS